MRIGVDACCWSNLRGFGRFTRELLTALLKIDRSNQYVFFADQQTASSSQFPDNVIKAVVQTSVSPTEAASASGRRSISDVWSMTRAVMKVPIDLFFFPAIYSYFPIFNRTKIALTIHDMIPAEFPTAVFPNKKLEYFWNLKEKAAIWQADRIVTVSDYSRKQIVKLRGVREEKKLELFPRLQAKLSGYFPQAKSAERFYLDLDCSRTNGFCFMLAESVHTKI